MCRTVAVGGAEPRHRLAGQRAREFTLPVGVGEPGGRGEGCLRAAEQVVDVPVADGERGVRQFAMSIQPGEATGAERAADVGVRRRRELPLAKRTDLDDDRSVDLDREDVGASHTRVRRSPLKAATTRPSIRRLRHRFYSNRRRPHMDTALVIGGTRFIGRHLVRDLLDHDYDVTILNRGTHENPFAVDDRVHRIEGDRTNDSVLEAAASEVDPDAVFDCVAYYPKDVQAATRIFADCAAYVYISSGAAYGREELPKREGETPLKSCSTEQAVDDSDGSYGARKAEGDRAVFAAAERGVNAMSVRPPIVYGPHDYTERLDFWIDRVNRFDRIVVPGDGTNVWHRAYVEDVASTLRVVAERGEAGEAYNTGDRRLVTLAEMVELIATAAGTDLDVVTAGPRELAAGEIDLEEYPLYRHYPHVLSTAKLADLGWESTPLEEAMVRSVESHLDSERDGREHGPDREAEERVLGILDTF
jgi:nucleoside-diphosphate-sugar epimerase